METSKYRELIRNFCVFNTIENTGITFNLIFKKPIKVESLSLEIVKLTYYRKNRNTLIYFSDEFSNTISLKKISNSECKQLYASILDANNKD